MNVTEIEAAKLLCPMGMASGNCGASLCMAWEWTGTENTGLHVMITAAQMNEKRNPGGSITHSFLNWFEMWRPNITEFPKPPEGGGWELAEGPQFDEDEYFWFVTYKRSHDPDRTGRCAMVARG